MNRRNQQEATMQFPEIDGYCADVSGLDTDEILRAIHDAVTNIKHQPEWRVAQFAIAYHELATRLNEAAYGRTE